jgi:hypothetical protein
MKLAEYKTLSSNRKGSLWRIQIRNHTNDYAYFVTDVLNNFIKKNPKVKLIIEELNTEEIIIA